MSSEGEGKKKRKAPKKRATSVKKSVPAKPKGSVTKALDTGEMSPRIFEFLHERLTALIKSRLSNMPGFPADAADILQEVALAALKVIPTTQFESRQDFAALCVTVAERRIHDISRKEFSIKRGGGKKRASPEVLESVSEDKRVSKRDSEVVEEIIDLAANVIEEPRKATEQMALTLWIAGAKTREIVAAITAQFPGKKPVSSRTVSRWIGKFQKQVCDVWAKKYGEQLFIK